MGLVTPPNESTFKSNMGDPGSSAPLGKHASTCSPPNEGAFKSTDGDPGGSYPTTKHASTINPPNANQKFSLADARTPLRPSAMQPGKGMIPIDLAANGVARSNPMPESVMRRGR